MPTFLGLLLVLPLASIRHMTNDRPRGKSWEGPTLMHYFITPAPAPKYFKPSLRLYMKPQDGKTCLPSIMSFVNKELCNGRRSTEFYIDMFEDAHPGVDVADDGIIGSRQTLINYIASNFETKSYHASGGIVASINAGNPMLTTIPYYDNTGTEQTHNILIVGYDSSVLDNPKVYYMDSRYGRIFNDINVASFNSSSPAYIFSITGCK